MADYSYEPMTTRDYLALLWRRRLIMAGTMAVCVAIAVAYSITATRVWEGRAELVVNSDAGARPSILSSAPLLGLLTDSSSLLGGTDLATQVQIISSRPCLEDAWALMHERPELLVRVRSEGVTDEMLEGLPELLAGLSDAPPPATWTGEYERLWDSLLVSAVEESQVVEVRGESADPEQACDFINAMVLAYLGRSLGDARAAARRSLHYIEEELADAEQRLAETEESLRGFAQYAGTVELQAAAEQQFALLVRLDEQAALAEARMRAQAALQGELQNRLGEQPEHVTASTVVARNPQISDLQRALAQAEADRVALLEEYQPAAAPVRAAQAKVDELRAGLADAAEEVTHSRDEQLNPVAQALVQQSVVASGERLAAGSSLDVLRTAVRRVEAKLAELPDEQITQLKLMREVGLAEKIYLALKEKEQEFEITEKTKMPAASLVEHAIAADEPVRPKPILNVVASIVAGAMLGLLLVAAAEHFDDGLHRPERLASMVGAPVVGALVVADAADEDARLVLAAVLGHMRSAANGGTALLIAPSARAGAEALAGALAREALAGGQPIALVTTGIAGLAPGDMPATIATAEADLAIVAPETGAGVLAASGLIRAGVPVYIAAHLRATRGSEVVRLARMVSDMGGRVAGAVATGASRPTASYVPVPMAHQ